MLRGRRLRRPLRFIALLLVATLIFLNTASGPSPNDIWHAVRRRHHQGDFPDTSICKSLPGANETVVILKTGSTELEDKLPIHVRTTLKCYPNNLIFSDYAEDFRTLTVLDALKDVSTKYKNHHTDFELYRRLQTSGRSSLDPDELSGPASQPQNGSSGMPSNPGWKLDKWKFLPMIRKTLDMFPEKEWYVFVETDTYMSWSNMLAFLNSLDSSQPYYIGNQMAIGDVLFAHGGSGFAVSRPALERAVGHYIGHKSDWERFVDGHWAGDCVLGKVFYESGTPLNWAWPSLQSDTLGSMNYERTDYDHRLWCYASISWHHLAPEDIEDLWRFEQQRLLEQDANSSSILRHKDVYAEYVLPRTMMPRANWDNQANEDKGPVASLEECRVICEGNDTCVQYSLSMGRCLTAPSPRLGEVSAGVDSGWIGERMRMFYEGAEPCGNEGWTN